MRREFRIQEKDGRYRIQMRWRGLFFWSLWQTVKTSGGNTRLFSTVNTAKAALDNLRDTYALQDNYRAPRWETVEHA
jgi:hypothetical protein